MAYPTSTYTASELAGVIPEIWTGKINDFMREKLVTAKFFTNLNDEITEGGDIFHVPVVSEMTAYSKTAGTAVTVNNTSITTVDLTVNTLSYCSFAIERNEMRQMLRRDAMVERLVRNAGYTVAAVLEDAIIALFAGFSNTQGTSAANLADSDILGALATLKTNNFDPEECAFFLSPNLTYRDLMSLSTYQGLDKSTLGDTQTRSMVGYVRGVPVYCSSRIGGTGGSSYSCVAHYDAIIHAETSVALETNYIPEQLAFLSTAYMMYGVIENRDGGGVWIKTAS